MSFKGLNRFLKCEIASRYFQQEDRTGVGTFSKKCVSRNFSDSSRPVGRRSSAARTGGRSPACSRTARTWRSRSRWGGRGRRRTWGSPGAGSCPPPAARTGLLSVCCTLHRSPYPALSPAAGAQHSRGSAVQLQLLCSAAGVTAAAGEGPITPSSDSRVAAERRPATRARPPRHPPAAQRTRSTAGAVRRGRPSAALSADRCPQPPRTRRRAQGWAAVDRFRFARGSKIN